VLGNEELLIESEVLGGSLYEVVASSDDFAVEGVDDRVGLLQKAVDTAYLLQVQLPFRWVFNHYAKINVAVTAADTSGQFLALDGR
jgi:hypothetical protein